MTKIKSCSRQFFIALVDSKETEQSLKKKLGLRRCSLDVKISTPKKAWKGTHIIAEWRGVFSLSSNFKVIYAIMQVHTYKELLWLKYEGSVPTLSWDIANCGIDGYS